MPIRPWLIIGISGRVGRELTQQLLEHSSSMVHP
jgi:hypothetical protein